MFRTKEYQMHIICNTTTVYCLGGSAGSADRHNVLIRDCSGKLQNGC